MIVIPERETPGISESAWADADAERRPEPDAVELAGLCAAVGQPEQPAEHGEVDRDLPR